MMPEATQRPVAGPYRPANYDCAQCGVHTGKAHEYYSVSDDVWALTGLGPDGGMLCIGCLESRIGRTLVPEDFNRPDFNAYMYGTMKVRRSSRLAQRMGAPCGT